MSTHDLNARIPLAFLLAGARAQVDTLGEAIDATQREQIIAYGLSPGRMLTVLQQHPMTLLMVDEVELALENSVARHVWVTRQ
ncbi:MAG TPA: ferrous iron transport protein A [Thiobacillus sp.]